MCLFFFLSPHTYLNNTVFSMYVCCCLFVCLNNEISISFVLSVFHFIAVALLLSFFLSLDSK